MNRTTSIARLLGLVALLAVLSAPGWTEGIKWHKSLDEALAAAKTSGKMVMLSEHTDWCHWCKELARVTWPDKAVIERSKEFECVQVDPEKTKVDPRYAANAFPTILFLTPEGEIADKVEGFLPPEQFVLEMEGAKDGAKRLAEMKDLEAKLAANPADRALAVQLAGVCLQCDRAKRVLELLQPLYEKLDATDASLRGDVAISYGVALVQDAQYEKGRTVLRDALAKFADHKRVVDARFWLGLAYANLGQLKEARDEWDRVVKADPQSSSGKQAAEFIKRADEQVQSRKQGRTHRSAPVLCLGAVGAGPHGRPVSERQNVLVYPTRASRYPTDLSCRFTMRGSFWKAGSRVKTLASDMTSPASGRPVGKSAPVTSAKIPSLSS
jgi:thioredoxin-related protein